MRESDTQDRESKQWLDSSIGGGGALLMTECKIVVVFTELIHANGHTKRIFLGLFSLR